MSDLITLEGPTLVDSFGPGFFRVAGQVINGAILLMPTSLCGWGGYNDIAGVIGHAADIDVLFVGTGREIAHLPADFRVAVENASIGVEAMASEIACRSYNDLISQGRRVGLAVLTV